MKRNMKRVLCLILGGVIFTSAFPDAPKENPAILRSLGKEADKAKNFEEAIRCADRMLAVPELDESNRIEARLIKGNALKSLNRAKEAIAEMNLILDREYKTLPSSHQMAWVGNFAAGLKDIPLLEKFLVFFERCPEKAEYQKKLLQNWKDNLGVLYLRKGTSALDAGKTGDAMELLRKAWEQSSSENTNFYFGLACLQERKYAEADRCAENLRTMKKENRYVILKSQSLFGLGKKKEGQKLLRDFLENHREEYISPYYYGLMGDAAGFLKDRKSMEQVIEHLNDNPSIPSYLKQKIAIWRKQIKNWPEPL